MQPNQKINWNTDFSNGLNLFRFILMVMVAYIHSFNLYAPWPTYYGFFTATFQYFFSDFVFRVAVPAFFLVSGFLLQVGKPAVFSFRVYFNTIKKRSHTLGLPYLIWVVPFVILRLVTSPTPHLGKWPAQFLHDVIFNPLPFQFWFIRNLFFFILLTPFFQFCNKYAKTTSIVAYALLWIFGLPITYYFGLGIYFFSNLWPFALGLWLGAHWPQLKTKPFLLPRFWLLFLLGLGLVCLIIWGGLALHYQKFGNYILGFGILASIFAMVQTVLWAHVTQWLVLNSKYKKTLVGLSGFTFAIFALHDPLLNQAKIFIAKNHLLTPLVTYLVLPLVCVGVALAIGVLWRRFWPAGYKVATGGR